ncbi:MAG: flippase-like domain-containing protein [Actinobacteria bacterium]|nr:flippase-like domain-containing protein [Actinomycetota bacterium]
MERSSTTKQRWVLALRIAVSVAMLAVLVDKLARSPSPDLPDFTASTAGWLAGAAALTLAGVLLSAVRWQVVLAALGQHVGYSRLLSHYLAGQFVANVLPTTIGGDVLRVSRLAKDSGETPASFASVVLERLTGWIVLPVITFVGFAVNPGLRRLGNATRVALFVAAAPIVLLGAVLWAMARHHSEDVMHETGWRRFLAAIALGLNRLRRQPSQILGVLGAGFAYQLVLVGAAVMAARAIDIRPAGPTALCAFLPAVLIAQVLPISISGVGVREFLFALFLRPLGVATEQAIALGLLLYLLNLVVSLLGAPAFAVGGRTRRVLA